MATAYKTPLPEKGVKLASADLDEMKKLARVAEDSFRAAEAIVGKALNRDAGRKGRDFRATFIRAEGSITIVLVDENGNCQGVYEDPPGICRPCGPGD